MLRSSLQLSASYLSLDMARPTGFGSGGGSLSAPVLTDADGWASGDAPAWAATYDYELYDAATGEGDQARARWRMDSGPWTTESWQPIDSNFLLDGAFTWPLLAAADLNGGGFFEVQEQRARDIGLADETFSAWSNIWDDNIPDYIPNAFSFTDQTNVALATQIFSNSITIAGVTAGRNIPFTLTGGEGRINGTGSWLTSGNLQLGDGFQLRQNSSALGTTSTSVTATIGGVADTWTIQTTAAVDNLPRSASLGLFIEAADTATLFKNVAGSSAVTADNDTVGYWADKSTAGFHLTATADDTTRPTYKTNSGRPRIAFDGTNDILRRAAAMTLWSASGFTIAIAFRSNNNTANKAFFGQGNTASSNEIMSPLHSVASNADNATPYFRNSAGADIISNSIAAATAIFSETDKVAIIQDDGVGTVSIYVDGALAGTRTYTRSGNSMTMNVFALGGLIRNTIGLWAAMDLYAFAAWPAVQLTASERATATTYFGSLQGRAI